MAVTVNTEMLTLSTCETTVGWTAHYRSGSAGLAVTVQISDEEVPPKEGTYCLGFDLDIENGGYVYGITSANYSAKLIYIWSFALNASALESVTNGGVYIIATDGTNYGYWYVGGNDNYRGGWKCFVADLSRTPNANNGTNPTMSAITGVGIGFNNTSKSKATRNMYFDYLRSCDKEQGIFVYTTGGSIAKWSDVYSGDESISAGVIRREGGVYFVQGPITVGSGNLTCQFEDSTQLIVYDNVDVPEGHCKFKVSGSTTTTTELILGQSSGGRGISGCVFKTAPSGALGVTKRYIFDFTDSDIDKLQLYGNSFIGSGPQYYPANATNREVISCNFDSCGLVEPSSCKFQYDNFITPESGGLLLGTPNHNLSYNTFINCPVAIDMPVSGYYGFNNLSFVSGVGTYDIQNRSGGGIVVSATDSNPANYKNVGAGSTTSIINTVPLIITVLDEDNNPIETAQVAIYSGVTELMNEDTIADGTASADYNYTGDAAVSVRIRKGSATDTPKYLPINSNQTIRSGGLELTFTLLVDINNNA